MMTLKRFRLAAALASATILSGPAVAEQFSTYRNARYGYSLEIPQSLASRGGETSENGDGVLLRSSSRQAELRAWGAHDDPDWGFPEARTAFAAQWPVSWQTSDPGGWVLTGTDGATIAYERCRRARQVLACFRITYPAADRAMWDAIVTRISRSLAN